ncbi:lipase family protein [Staphylococcus xylosus]|uniref:lipase family protein n=1 Tax=Staphylococcus xylosus TaxID=1288 RepID=UPI001F29E160|nr:lipase family protein [Staphylococcus xylosus]MCE7782025.1 lipase family protein [Staphylococcus xylosus]
MKPTDLQSQKLAEYSYRDLKKDKSYVINDQQYQIIEKRDDTQNGLRAYAYAPIVNGKPDTNNIVMGYAGTELASMKDWKTNANLPFHNNTTNLKIDNHYKKLKNTTINEKYNKPTDDNDMLNTMDSFGEMITKKMTHSYEPNDIATKGTPSQIGESAAFTQAVKDKYPNSKLYAGGHSLGGYLAQYNAIKFNFESTTTFAAPNTYGAFSGDIKKQIDEGKYNGKIKNVGHDDDIVNSLDFFKPRIGSDIITAPKYDGFLTSLPFVGQHFIGTYDNFDKKGSAKEMSKGELAAYKKAKKMFNPFNILTTDKDPAGLDDTISAFIKKLNKKVKADKASKTKKGSKSISKSSKSVKGDSDASAKKGKGGSRGSGKKIKIQPEAIRTIANKLRDRTHIYDAIIRALEESERETKRNAQRILDKYESELLSGSHKFISPRHLEEYMENMAQGGSIGNLEFYNNYEMEQMIQDLHKNKKELLKFAEKLEYAADKFEEKDLEESDVFGLFS